MSRLPPYRVHHKISNFQCWFAYGFGHKAAFRWDVLFAEHAESTENGLHRSVVTAANVALPEPAGRLPAVGACRLR